MPVRLDELDAAPPAAPARAGKRRLADLDAIGTGFPPTGEAAEFEQARALAGETRVGIGDVAAEVPRAIGRGAGMGLEFMGDVLEAPLETRIPAGFAAADTPEAARAWTAENPQLAPSAGDRLRAAAAGALGLDRLTERRLPRTDSPFAEGVVTGAEAFGAGAMGGGLFSAGARAATTLGAAGAGLGRAAAEGLDLGPAGTALFEVAGEVIGAASPAAAARFQTAVKQAAQKQASPRTRREAVETVNKAILKHLPKGVRVDDLYRQARERIGRSDLETLGMAFDTPGARGVEETVGQMPGMRNILRQRGDEVREQVVSRLRDVEPGGDPLRALQVQAEATRGAEQQAAKASDAAVGTAESTAANRLRQAQAQAEGVTQQAEAARPLAFGAADVEPAGLEAASRIDAARDAAKEVENAAWAQVPKSTLVPTQGLKLRLAQIMRDIPAPERKRYRAANAQLLGDLAKLPKASSGRNLISLERLVSDPPKAGEAPDYFDAINTRISRAILDHLDAQDELGEAFQTAREASKRRIRTFDTGLIGKARRATGDAPAELANRLVPGGAKGGETIRAAQAAGVDTRALILSQFRRRAYDAEGAFRGSAARNFLQTHQPALRAAGLEDEVADLVRRETRAIETGKELPRVERAIEQRRAQDVTEAGRLRAAEEARIAASAPAQFRGETRAAAAKAARDAMDSPFAPTRLRELQSTAAAAGPEAVKDLQRAFADAFIRDAVDVSGEGSKLTGDTAARLRRDREALAQVLSPDQLERIDAAIEPLGRLRGTIGGVEKFEAASGRGDWAKNLLLRMLAVSGAGAMGVNSLIAANVAAGQTNRILKRIPQQRLERLLRDYVLNPEMFLDDFKSLAVDNLSPTEATDRLNAILTGTAVGTAAGSRIGEE